MTLARFFVCPITEPEVELSPEEGRHAVGARRLRVGDEVELFDGQGRRARGRVEMIRKGRVTVAVEALQMAAPVEGRITLAASIAKGERFDWLVEKCTELGVDRIVPVRYSRTVKQASGERARQRYERLAVAAAKQSGRVYLPEIAEPMGLADCLAEIAARAEATTLLYGSWAPAATPVTQAWTGRDVTAFVGPEGGLTAEEEEMLIRGQAKAVRLTGTILRVETAAVAFVAVLASLRDQQVGGS